MNTKNPLLKGRATKTMQKRVLRLLDRADRLYRAERVVWRRLEAIVDSIVRREHAKAGLLAISWETEVDPSQLDVGIRFWMKANFKRGRRGQPDPKDVRRADDLARILGREVIPAVRRALGATVGYQVEVD